MRSSLIAAILVVLLGPAVRGETEKAADEEKLPQGAKVVALGAYPVKIELGSRYAYRQLVLTATLASGDRIDATRLARIQPPAALAEVSARGLVRGKADGSGWLSCTMGDQSIRVPLEVRGLRAEYAVSFVGDVMPAIAKMGCNAGTCHGSAKGKNGFKLSLRGYDPLFDHRALTDDLAGRRFNRAAPDQSLMLLKASGSVPHTGGLLTRPGEPYYELLRAWIAAGVKFDKDGPRPTALEVFPKDITLPLPGMKQQLAVTATFSDGSVRDVSNEAFVETNNVEVLSVDKHGLATALRRGEAAILVRYEGNYAVATVTVMGDRGGFAWKDVPTNNYIDELVYAKLKKLRIEPSGIATDAEFLRRIHLDLTGLPPMPEEVRALSGRRPRFAGQTRRGDRPADRQPGVSGALDQQVGRPVGGQSEDDQSGGGRRHAEVDPAGAGRQHALRQVRAYDPHGVAARRSRTRRPLITRWSARRKPPMENTTQLFLGVRFNCNKCHDHPFERWTQNQYYQLAAYFAQHRPQAGAGLATADKNGGPCREAVRWSEMIPTARPAKSSTSARRAGRPARVPFTRRSGRRPTCQPPRAVGPRGSRRQGKSATSPRATSIASGATCWAWDSSSRWTTSAPATRPPIPNCSDRLTADFVAGGFNPQELMRLICKSRVYQHSIATNDWNADDDDQLLARPGPAAAGRDALRRHPRSDRLGAPLPGVPGGLPARCSSRSGRARCPTAFWISSAGRRARARASASGRTA